MADRSGIRSRDFSVLHYSLLGFSHTAFPQKREAVVEAGIIYYKNQKALKETTRGPRLPTTVRQHRAPLPARPVPLT